MFAYEIPEAIQWYEGMLLTPQHMQQHSSRIEMLLRYSSLVASPYGWGIRRFTLDPKLLPGGTFVVLELEAVMPDGSVVYHKAENRSDLLLELKPAPGEISIHVALPAQSGGMSKGALSRYSSVEGPPVQDENTGEGDVRIPRLRHQLSLLSGDTPPPKYVSFPLAKVKFQDEICSLTDYIPPSLSVPMRSALGTLCSELVEALRRKAQTVADKLLGKASSQADALLTENRGRLQNIVGGLPLFEALLSSENSHPFQLYLATCSLAGNLAALGIGRLPPELKPYNHNDLRESFRRVLEFSFQMLEEGIPDNYSSIPFHLKDGVFGLSFDGGWTNRRLVLGMKMASGVTEREMIAWGEQCLIATAAIIPSLRDKRISGALRTFIERDDDLIPARGVILFQLQLDHKFITPGETLQILNFGELDASARPLEVVLYVKQRG